MGTRHVTELLSAAYDGALSPADQRRCDEHLAACSDCAAAADRLRQTVDAVRALPAARMPRRVVLPATPPLPEKRRATVPEWLGRLPRPALSPAWGAGTLAAAGLVAAVVAVHAHLGGSPSATAGALAPGAQAAQSDSHAASGGAHAPLPTAGIGTCPLPLAVVPQPAGVPAEPSGFSNTTAATSPQRPGERLVLATTTTKVTPGQQVLIYSALTTGGGQAHSAVIPCVSLHGMGATALLPDQGGGSAQNGTSAGSGAGGSVSGSPAPAPAEGAPGPSSVAVGGGAGSQAAAAPPARDAPASNTSLGTLLSPAQVQAFAPYALLPPLAVASPASAAVSTLPLQVIQIPSYLPPGTTLQLIALVPSGLPAGSDQPAVEAVLTLEVS